MADNEVSYYQANEYDEQQNEVDVQDAQDDDSYDDEDNYAENNDVPQWYQEDMLSYSMKPWEPESWEFVQDLKEEQAKYDQGD
ncbi:hypothetical protein MP228_004494 [Amoeboaphelidium protococcarum]|nr:hypothetical protein MP228_004494 [Amoeboaphelidium protococcarum]